MKLLKYLKLMSQLGKFKITIAAALSSAAGYILVYPQLNFDLLYLISGIFILSSGCSTLNQFQERATDSMMSRTQKRPIPSGSISPFSALLIALIEIAISLLFLYLKFGFIVFILGLFAFVWYNFAYTYLKKITSLAVIPGALIGAVPPAMGWIAAGGNLNDPVLHVLSFFFFVWQIPHFWLLMLLYSEDYKTAGFPVIDDLFRKRAAQIITYSWIICLSAACILLLFFRPVENQFTGILLIAASLIIIWDSRKLLRNITDKIIYRRIFVEVNAYVLFTVLLLSIDKLIRFNI